MKKGILVIFITILFLSLTSSQAFAIPTLQLYTEGSTYDTVTESWVIITGEPFILWVLGDVGNYGNIDDVQLTTAFLSSESGTITITPTTATSTLISDPSIPPSPVLSGTGANIPPTTGSGDLLPPHGVYGPGTSWNTYAIGDFTLTDSPIGDFINTFPTSFPSTGQINAYIIDIEGYSTVHFDAFDYIVINDNHVKYVKAPFSHDTTGVIPEPGTLLLLGSGLVGVAAYYRRRKTK